MSILNSLLMKKITYEEYLKAAEKIEILLDQVDENTPHNSPKMIELINASDIVEAYEEIHYKLTGPSALDKIRFYFEQRFKFGKNQTDSESNEEITFFNEEDLADLRNIVNDFDAEEWQWNIDEEENLNKIKELIKQVENEPLEFRYSA